MYVCMHVYMYVWMNVHVCMYECMYACMYVRTYVCMYVYLFVRPSFRPSVRLPGAGLPQSVLLLPLLTTSCWLEYMQLAYNYSSFTSPTSPPMVVIDI